MFDKLFDDSVGSIETGSSTRAGGSAVEMFRVPKFKREKTLLEVASSHKDYGQIVSKTTASVTTNVADWLPFCAEKYKISPDLSDYVVVAVPIVASDIPNRNLACFSFEKLTEFNPELGMLNYRSWVGKPTFVEHVNHDYTQAKGVIFGSTLQKMSNTVDPIWKVVALCGFDRTRDPVLAENILTGRSTGYSMGAKVFGYHCSICGSVAARPDRPRCDHVDPTRRALRIVESGSYKKLAYWNVGTFSGFETSSVEDPAFRGADSSYLIDASR